MIHTQFNPQKACSSRPKENHNSENKERSSLCGRKQRKRQRTAALQDAVATDCVTFLPRGLGVRLSSAALASVHWRALSNPGSTQYRIMEPPYLGCYNMK